MSLDTPLHLLIDSIRWDERSAHQQDAALPQDASRLAEEAAPALHAAENLNQHDRVERPISKRELLSVRLHKQRSSAVAIMGLPHEFPKHTER